MDPSREQAQFPRPGLPGRRDPLLLLRLRRSAHSVSCSNGGTLSATIPNIRWQSTLAWPRSRTCRPPNASLSRPLTRSTLERSW